MTTVQPSPAYRMLLPILVVAFIVVSVAEVWLLTVVGSRIGIWPTLAILVVEAFIGAALLRYEGKKSWRALVSAYEAGKVPTGQLADAALVLVGGIMLILPGFFTDLIGLAFLLPFSRPLVRKALGWVVARQSARAGVDVRLLRAKYTPGTVPGEVVDETGGAQPPEPTVISGEIER